MIRDIEAGIDMHGPWTEKDDCLALINGHAFWFQSQRQAAVLADYVSAEVKSLDKQIDELLNTALDSYQREIAKISFKDVELVRNILDNRLNRLAALELESFFLQYAGKGGLKSGVPNAAKAILKKAGEKFDVTFKRETHNALAQFLKRVGANSARGVAAAAAVIVEGVLYVGDVATWKAILRRKAKKKIRKWADTVLPSVQHDLIELQNRNLRVIISFFDEFREPVIPVKKFENLTELRDLQGDINSAISNTHILLGDKTHEHGLETTGSNR